MVNLEFNTQVVIVIGISLTLSFILNLFLKKINFPTIIAPLLVGLSLNFWFLKYLSFLPDFVSIISLFANFGLIVVLFFIGLRVDFHFMKNLSRSSSVMALFSGLLPLVFGFIATFMFTKNWIESLFVGIALAVTAEEVSIAILEELNILNRRIGQIIIDAGIIGDIFEILAITLLGLFLRALEKLTILNLFIELFLFVFITLAMRYYIIEWLFRHTGKLGKKLEYFTVAMIVLLMMTMASEMLNFSHVIGALLAGLLLKDKLTEDKLYYEEHHIIEAIEVFNFGVFHPLIFIWIGLSIDINLMFSNIFLGIALTLIAIFGKLAGCVLGNMFTKEPISEGILIGWGLNPRGATELFAVLIAKSQGLISSDIFSAIVFVAIITTIISPIIFKMLVIRGFGIIDHTAHKHR